MPRLKKALVQAVVWKAEDHFVARCLSLDLSALGKTKAEALGSLDDELAAYFEEFSPRDIAPIHGVEVEPRIVKYYSERPYFMPDPSMPALKLTENPSFASITPKFG